MNQCESETISTGNQLGEDSDMNNTAACPTEPVADAVSVRGSGDSEEQNHTELQSQPEAEHADSQQLAQQLQTSNMNKQLELEQGAKSQSVEQNVTQTPTSNSTAMTITMKSKIDPPPLQPINHHHVPSNQTNAILGSTTSCITGFQSTFSQEHVGLPDPHRATHYTDALPGSACQQYQWHHHQQVPIQHHQPHYHHPNQYININNNASPESFGIERPGIGLVQQVLEIFKISGKLEMQPSEIYFELEKKYPYYRFLTPQKRKSWMSSVRHALTNPQFKARRCTEDEGKPIGSRRGHFWSIDENYVPGQENTPNRPPAFRRRSKVMKAGGGCNFIRSPSGQLFPDPLASASLMSPPMTYATTLQSNGIPVILPTPQFTGQALQLVPTINQTQAFPKQSPGGNNGQFLWIPSASASPQHQPQLQQHQMQFSGNSQWGNSPVATYQPGFNANVANNYNFSNNIQQLQQQGQLQPQHHHAHALHNAQAFRYPNIKQQPEQNFTTGSKVNVGSNLSEQNSDDQLHLQQQLPQQQQQQGTEQPISSSTQVSSCAAAVQAFADLARATENLASQPDIGPGGDTTPTPQASVNGDGPDDQQISPDSQVTITDIGESQQLQINSQNLEDTKEPCTLQEKQEPADENNSSVPSSGQTKHELFPVTLYTSGGTGEKTVLPSVETLAKDLAEHTQRREDELKFKGQTDNKNLEEGKSDLRAMVYNEVCRSTQSEQEEPSMLSTHITNAATAESCATGMQQSDTVTLQVAQPSVDQANSHWSVEQVQY